MSKLFSKEELESLEKEQEFVNELIVKYQKKIDDIKDLTYLVPAKKHELFIKHLYNTLIRLNTEYEYLLEL